jgi:hypothetical protein
MKYNSSARERPNHLDLEELLIYEFKMPGIHTSVMYDSSIL